MPVAVAEGRASLAEAASADGGVGAAAALDRGSGSSALEAVPSTATEWFVGYDFKAQRAYRERYADMSFKRLLMLAEAGATPMDNLKVMLRDGTIRTVPCVFAKDLLSRLSFRTPCTGSLGYAKDCKEVAVRRIKDRTPGCVLLVNGEHKLQVTYEEMGGRDAAEGLTLDLGRALRKGLISVDQLASHRDQAIASKGYDAGSMTPPDASMHHAQGGKETQSDKVQ